MNKRQESAKKSWVTIRQKYGDSWIAKKAWETRRFNQVSDMTEDEYMEYIHEQYKLEYETAEHKRIRDLIRCAGGVNDSDYETIPRWAKRKNGKPMDELVGEMAEHGVHLASADDLYVLLQEVSP